MRYYVSLSCLSSLRICVQWDPVNDVYTCPYSLGLPPQITYSVMWCPWMFLFVIESHYNLCWFAVLCKFQLTPSNKFAWLPSQKHESYNGMQIPAMYPPPSHVCMRACEKCMNVHVSICMCACEQACMWAMQWNQEKLHGGLCCIIHMFVTTLVSHRGTIWMGETWQNRWFSG